jgi:hypothetical protein
MKVKGWIEKSVNAIIEDLRDRKGLNQIWNGIDKDLRDEIEDAWGDIIASFYASRNVLDNDEPLIDPLSDGPDNNDGC